MRRGPFLFFAFLTIFASSNLLAGPAPICDTECNPTTSDGNYNTYVSRNRPVVYNQRQSASAYAPLAFGSKRRVNIGSQSFNYTVPLLHWPGRDGLDLNLNLYYNSLVWTIDKTDLTATFNGDRDFPSYGFRLGYGYLEFDSTDNFYILTQADGSKVQLSVADGHGNFVGGWPTRKVGAPP